VAKNVLLVDDSKTVRQQVGSAIKGGGFGVVEACDGKEALSILTARRGEIAMVICDVNMPVMGGLELLEAISQRSDCADLPVVILTTEARQNLKERAKSAGAKGWIVKPFNPRVLLAAVQKFTGAPTA
jgi:two-component system chemotaxis response regulator CheY